MCVQYNAGYGVGWYNFVGGWRARWWSDIDEELYGDKAWAVGGEENENGNVRAPEGITTKNG